MLIDIEFAKWSDVKEALESDPETVLFDLSNLDRMLIVETVNTYEWNDCLLVLENNFDNILGGCWISSISNHTKYLEELTKHHENKGETNVS